MHCISCQPTDVFVDGGRAEVNLHALCIVAFQEMQLLGAVQRQ